MAATWTRLTEDGIRELVHDVLDGRVLVSQQVPSDLWGAVFLPISLGALKDWTPEERAQIGVVYGRYSKALPRSINGYPIFTEVQLVHVDDWTRAVLAIDREQQRRKEIPV